ncbi:MAG: hypothetical protein DLM64_03605 [Solirubrobacterales bacterium]|nr:MAG: hypothetical protein DLM64_03605 [Solirubrobacterales bacterium]
MTHEQATARCERLNREETGARHWFAKQAGDDDWQVVSATAPGLQAHGPLKEGVGMQPGTPDPPDPRPAIIRNIPPYGPGIA